MSDYQKYVTNDRTTDNSFIELVLVVDESCDKFGFISQEAIERTLLFEFVFSNGFPLSKTTLPSVSRCPIALWIYFSAGFD